MKFHQLLVFAILLAWGCKNDAPPPQQQAAPKPVATGITEIGQYPYQFYVKNQGATPIPGDAVQYYHCLMQGDSVLQSTFGTQPSAGIFPRDDEAKRNPQALIEGLRLMTEGDSLSITAKMDDTPKGMYRYDLKLVKIYPVSGIPVQKEVPK